mgnify:CR=1 FL=1
MFQRLYSSGAFGVDYENARSAPPGQPQVNGIYFSDPKGDGTDVRDANGQPMAPPQTPVLHKNVSPQPVDLRRFMIGRLNQGQAGVQAFFGQIGEFLLFNRALSVEEQKQVEAYLNKKYSLDAQAQ